MATATLDSPLTTTAPLAVQLDLFDTDLDYANLFKIPLVIEPQKDKPLPLWRSPLPHTALWNAYQSQRLWFLPQTSIDSDERKMRVVTPIKRFKSEKVKTKKR
jgi:hypothetical protein